jgi:hypothetical protein
MKPSIHLPREKIVELLQASGSTLTPEEYAASLPPVQAFTKYPGRARAAAWSKNILIFVTVISALVALFDFGIENTILLIGLATVSYFETRVHRYFREDNPDAPQLGFRNQAGFAAGILVYGLYHAVVTSPTTLPPEYRDLVDAPTMQMIQEMTRLTYLIVGIVGGISQFGLAWYYRSAQSKDA